MITRSDEKASRQFLNKCRIGRLGIVLEDGRPYVVPVNYLMKDKCIYIHSLPGIKMSAMKANPDICLQADEVSPGGFEWQSVIAFGKFEQVDDKKKRLAILREFYKKFPNFTPVEAMFEEGDVAEDIVVFRINIDRITGVSEKY